MQLYAGVTLFPWPLVERGVPTYIAQPEELLINLLLVGQFHLYHIDVFPPLQYFPLPHTYRLINLRQSQYNFLHLFKFLRVYSIRLILFGVVSSGQYAA